MTDRERDATLARALFGLEVVGEATCYHTADCGTLEVAEPDYDGWRGAETHPVYVGCCSCAVAEPDTQRICGHTYHCLEPIPYYSTTGDGMLAVIEQLRERGWQANVNCRLDGSVRCDLALPDPRDEDLFDHHSATESTAPAAVARAAARALGVEE